MRKEQTEKHTTDHSSLDQTQSRRTFIKSSAYLGSLGSIGATGVLGNMAFINEAEAGPFKNHDMKLDSNLRAKQAFKARHDAARNNYKATLRLPEQTTNGDDRRYRRDNYYASFTKTLEHNQYGEVDPRAYKRLLKAQKTGKESHFNAIPQDPIAERGLANPQGGLRYIYAGLDGHATRMRPAPAFRSAETAGEMGELYWQAMTRDIPFNQYDNRVEIDNALYDLNTHFTESVGPKEFGVITANTLFRGPTSGDLVGPYVSQFLWHKIPFGPSVIEQKYEKPMASDFMLDETHWLNIQKGANPLENIYFESEYRYIHDNRSLGEYVHRDVLFQAYLNAAMILLGFGSEAIDPNNPYTNGSIQNQGNFTSFGGPFVLDLVTQAGNLALQGAWYQKWLVHRRLRPEAFGGRIHFANTANRAYEIHSDILNSNALAEAFTRNGSYFLPMAYTEGSPTHPSYPAGHATVSGACTTVLKAFFNEDYVIPNPQVSTDDGRDLTPYYGTDLTVGGELNKLGSNIAIARNAAGVHYRSDGVDGMLVGEQQAIALLQDYSLSVNEDFDGFNLTKFDGEKIIIKKGRTYSA